MAGEIRPLGIIAVSQSLSVLAEPSPEASYPAALHSVHFEAAMRTLRRYHDYVVIDGPPVLGSGDANVIEDASDGIVLVARASLTRASSLTRAAEQLGDRRILGVVLNDVAPRPVARKRVCIDGEPAGQSGLRRSEEAPRGAQGKKRGRSSGGALAPVPTSIDSLSVLQRSRDIVAIRT